MTEDWAIEAYRNLLDARKTWRKLREKYPDAYDYESKLTTINQKMRFLVSWVAVQQRSEAEPKDEEKPSEPQPIIQPDTIPDERDTEPRDDEWFSDVFFEDEGIVAADLPAESELTVSGRKFIKANLNATDYPNDPQRESSSDVSIDQQLQVKVRGSVADDLLEVQIDFDDSLPKVERQKTRVLYNGGERDAGFATFQAQGKFGDVNLSLPGSHFVSYNKNVFGLSGQAHLTDIALGEWGPEKISFYAVASEKKGETQKKVFTGNNQRRVPDPVADINPIRRTYYQPLADTPAGNRSLPVEAGSERIFVDDRNEENNDANTIENKTVKNDTDSYTGDFDELTAGEDYSINYRTGVIRFTRNIQNNSAIAVTMTLNDGSTLDDFLIKDPEESEKYDRYHLRNRYRLASRNIVRDDPDRVLEIRDPTDSTQPDGNASYAELLGLDRDNDGVIDNEFIDFELGVLRFPVTRPFTDTKLASEGADTNPTVYGPPSQRQKVYEIYQEVLVEENTYSLGVNVVRASETVKVDGQNLERGKDYTIDYQTGFLAFFDHVEIDDETRIEVTYEQQGAGAQRDETFLGGRMEAEVSDNLSMGSTLLTSDQAQRGRVPQVGSTSKSTEISEYDVDWEPLHTVQDILGLVDEGWSNYPLDDQLTLDLNYEKARSTRNPAQEGLALIDDFSQLDQRVVFSKGEFDWFPADPIQQFPGGQTVLNNRSGFELDEADNRGHDPDPEQEDSQRSLRVNFDMGTSSDPDTWGSIQQVFSSNGRDLRGYQYLEFWVKWENNADGGTLAVDLGEVTENTNRGGLLTEDDNNDDVLNPGEDDGYVTHDFRFGEDNGQLDSEDLDGNGRLDEEEGYLHFPSVNTADAVIQDTTSHGWTLLKIPLRADYGETRGDANIEGKIRKDTPTRSEVLNNAGMVRLVYEAPDASGKKRSFLLEQMGVVQTRWQTRRDTPGFSLDVKSSVEDPRLPAPNTSKLRDDKDRIEKALSYTFNDIDAADSEFTRAFVDFPGGQNIRQFKKMNLLFNTDRYNPGAGSDDDTGFLRFGTDKDNYFQYEFSLADPDKDDPRVESVGGGWYQLSLNLKQFEQDLIKKTLFDTSPNTFERGNRTIVGDPSLLKVKQYVIGFVGPSSPEDGELLFEGLHVSDPRKEVGEAKQVQANVDVREGLVKFNAREREVDGEFRTIGLVNNAIANQFVAQNEESRSVNGSVDVNRYIPNSWSISIPLNFNWTDQTTEIPPDRIERVRNENLGVVQNQSEQINSGLNTPSFVPSFSFSWRENSKDVDQDRRRKRWSETRESWNLGGNYGLTFREPIGGYFPVGNRLNMSFNGTYGQLSDRTRSFGEVDVDTETRDETTRKLSTTINHEPWGWLDSRTRLNFSDLNRSTRRSEGLIKRNQSLDFEFDFSSFLGLQPRFSFGTGIKENYDRGDGVSKNVGLNGNSSLRINTNPRQWWSVLDFLSLNYNYSVSSSARYSSLDPTTSNGRIYRNFYDGLGWILTGPEITVTSDTLTLSRNRANKNVSHRIGGQLRLWAPLDSRYDINFSQNFGQSDNSVNRTNALSLSLSNRLRLQDVSSLIRDNTQNASLELDYSFSRTNSSNSISRTHSPNFSFNTRWNRWWSTNFNLSTQFTREKDRKVRIKGERYSPSLDFKWLVNEAGSSEGTLWFDNRLEINGGLSGQIQERTRNDETRQDEWDASMNFGGSYNVTERIKTRFGGSYSVFRDRFREANDRNSYGFNASLDFRF